ncbi:MAG TPA: mandelate racemase/muconate lactonizing enzyme family protein [Arenicellales bacterium]|jgi:L-alanine-DL-glutamate epimerase-like enolase superfamily enzyme|nr:mandelate racemase/muconate lactonizing enzyme family protein [Arenicellales bacterium]HJL57307.1 mandelate racemase/muconate lactonizing enzyme family protein [Arenicellales bacterium]
MKLSELEIFVVGNPPPGWGGRYFVFVKVTASNGLVGYGEVYSASVGPEAMRAVIEDVFERHMAGENPENTEMMFRRAYSSGFTQRPDLTVMGAFSGLEMACWDILGKAHERPVYALLGGLMNERIRSYSYLYPLAHHDLNTFWNDPQMTAESAAEMVEQGFTAVKFDPAGPYTVRGGHQPALSDIERSVTICRRIRETVGNRADILFGTHGQFTTAGAIRLARRLEPYDPLWFEEPCPPDNLLEFANVAKQCRIPVATGERLTTKVEFATLLRTGGVAILQPALGRSGGILETKKIAAIAESFNAQIAPHLYAGPVEWAANIQLAANIPNLLMVETIQTGGEFHRQLIGDTIRWEGGYIDPPTAPGLGIEFNEALARAHPWQGAGLHLEMQEAPCNYSTENVFLGGAPPVAEKTVD